MATAQEAVSRLEIDSTVSGVDESTRKLNELAAAYGGVAVQSTTAEKATGTLDSNFAKLERRLNTTAAQAAQFEKIQRQVNAAVAQNPALSTRAAEVLALAAERYGVATKAANDNSAATGLNRAQLLELGHAAKASFEQIAAGAPALTILSQQGASVAQALGSGAGGVGGSLSAIARTVVTTLGPLGTLAAALLAVGAAALVYFNVIKKDGPTTEQLFKEHDRLLNVIKASYDRVTDSTRKWFDQSKDVTQLQLLQQQLDLQQKLTEATVKAIRPTVHLDLGTGEVDVLPKFKAFRDALADLNESWQKGTPAVKEFMDEVARIALANPALQKLGVELINSVGDANKFAMALKQVNDALKLINGGKLSEDERGRLGLPDVTPQKISAYEQLIDRTKDRIETLKLEAQTAGQVTGAVEALKLQQDAVAAAKKSHVAVDQAQIDNLKQELIYRQKLKDIATVNADIEFQNKTALLNPQDVAIAQQLRSIFGNDIPAALESSQAAAIRFNNTLKSIGDLVRQSATAFATDLVNGLRQGNSLMSSLGNAARNLSQALTSKAFTDLFSGNFVAAGIEGLGALITGLFGDAQAEKDKQAQQLQQAADTWRQAGPEFKKFITEMTGGVQGDLAQQIDTAAEQMQKLQDEARAAGDWTAVQQIQEAYTKHITSIKQTFIDSFDEMTQALESGLGTDSPFLKAVENVKNALTAALKFIDDTRTVSIYSANNPGGTIDSTMIDRARLAEQGYLLSLLQTAKPLSTVQEGLLKIQGTASALQGALEQLGLSSDAAAAAIKDGVTKAIDALATDFSDSLTRRFNAATGKDYLNSAADLLKQHQQDLADAAALGNDPALLARINATFAAEIQKLVDDTGLAGSAFSDFIKLFPEFTDAIHQGATEIQKYIDSLKLGSNSTLSPQDQLALAQSNFQKQLGLASHGDAGALASITQYAQTYLDQAKSFYASSGGYADIFSAVTAALQALIGGTGGGLSTTQFDMTGGSAALGSGTTGLIGAMPQQTSTAANDNAILFQQQTSALSNVMMQGFNGLASATSTSGSEIADLLRQLLAEIKNPTTKALRPVERAAA